MNHYLMRQRNHSFLMKAVEKLFGKDEKNESVPFFTGTSQEVKRNGIYSSFTSGRRRRILG